MLVVHLILVYYNIFFAFERQAYCFAACSFTLWNKRKELCFHAFRREHAAAKLVRQLSRFVKQKIQRKASARLGSVCHHLFCKFKHEQKRVHLRKLCKVVMPAVFLFEKFTESFKKFKRVSICKRKPRERISEAFTV